MPSVARHLRRAQVEQPEDEAHQHNAPHHTEPALHLPLEIAPEHQLLADRRCERDHEQDVEHVELGSQHLFEQRGLLLVPRLPRLRQRHPRVELPKPRHEREQRH